MNKPIYLFILFVAFWSCENANQKISNISLDTPKDNIIDSIMVGAPIFISDLNVNQITPHTLLKIENSYGFDLLNAKDLLQGNKIEIPKKYTLKKGLLEVVIFQYDQAVLNKKYYLKPLNSISKLENYFGQKFIHLNAPEEPEIVTFLLDPYDNFTKAEVPLKYNIIENQTIEKAEIESPKEIAIFEIPKTDKIGKKSVSIHYKNIHSREEAFYLLAGMPEDFTISAKLNHQLADGNTLFEIETSVIRDKFGNKVNDGTQIEFAITDENNITVYKFGQTVNGKAHIQMVHPTKSKEIIIQGLVYPQAKSNALIVKFEPAIEEIPITVEDQKIMIGPMVTINKNYVPHATEVQVRLYDNHKNQIKIWHRNTDNGSLILELPSQLNSGNYFLEVECLGFIAPLKKLAL